MTPVVESVCLLLKLAIHWRQTVHAYIMLPFWNTILYVQTWEIRIYNSVTFDLIDAVLEYTALPNFHSTHLTTFLIFCLFFQQ